MNPEVIKTIECIVFVVALISWGGFLGFLCLRIYFNAQVEFAKMLHEKEKEHNKVLWEMYKSEADARLELQKFVKEQFKLAYRIPVDEETDRYNS